MTTDTTNTPNNKLTSLVDQFMKIVETGDEKAAENFLADHLNEFPDEIRKKITFAFFSKAIQDQAADIEQKTVLQKEAMSVLTDIEKDEKTLEEEKKQEEVRSKLGI